MIMEIDVKKMAEILSEGEGISMGAFQLYGKDALGVMFVRAEHIPELKQMAGDWIERVKNKDNK